MKIDAINPTFEKEYILTEQRTDFGKDKPTDVWVQPIKLDMNR